MNINREIEASLARNFNGPSRFLLAVSGGPDSQVLIKAFSHVAKKLGSTVSALGVNHGLRPEAEGELDIAGSLCEAEGVQFERQHLSLTYGSNLQSRARDARYDVLLKKAYENGAVLVTAHHKDDRAETVLIRLMRASSAKSLGVLPEVQPRLYGGKEVRVFRPMLRVSRQDIESYTKRWCIQYATDPSNSDDHYLRVWVRQTLIPMMKEKSPDIVNKLNMISNELIEL